MIAWPTQTLSNDVRDRFFREAPKAWSELLERRTVFGQVKTWRREEPANGDVKTERIVYKAAPKRFLMIHERATRNKTSETHECGAWCVNEAYAFELKRKTASDPWALSELVVFGREGDPSRLLRLRDYQEYLAKYDLLVVLQMPLPELMKRPYFKVSYPRALKADGNEYGELAFEYDHPPDEMVPVLGHPVMFDKGTVILDPGRFWVIKSYQCTGKPSRWGGEGKAVVHCELEGDALPVLRRREQQSEQKGTVEGAPRLVVRMTEEFQEVELSRPPSADEFTLSAFGLSDPRVPAAPSTRWWLWGSLAGGALLVLAGVFGWLRQRAMR
jgi:hypothetical protein